MKHNEKDKQRETMTDTKEIFDKTRPYVNTAHAVLSGVVVSASRTPWNKGKRKPVIDDCGNEWCNCIEPNLTSNAGGRGQAYCLKCGTPWYH